MYQLVETQDSRIAQYSFGKSISQYGMTVFSCNSARKGKKIFGNDPDPTTEIMVQTQDDIISAHIKDNPNGKVAGYEDIKQSVDIHIKFIIGQYRSAAHGRVTH